MFWRILLVICGLTFLGNGCQVLGDENCNSVDIGGNRRAMSYECHRSPHVGEFSGSTAGGLGVAIGSGMILLAIWPFVRGVVEARSQAPGIGGYQSSSPPPSEPRREQTRTSNPPRDPPRSSRSRFCAQCGVALSASAKFCGACGHKVGG